MMAVAEGFAISISRIPEAELTFALIEFLTFFHELSISSRGLSE